ELAALVLARHHDAGRLVRDAHCGARLVDVLTTRAGRAIYVDAKVLVLDVDLDRIIDDRVDEHTRERRMTTTLRIDRRYAHEPVHALLRLQVAVRILALDLQRHALDARLFARLKVQRRHLETVALRPALIHAHEHLRPVLRLRATGARMDCEQRVAAVIHT